MLSTAVGRAVTCQIVVSLLLKNFFYYLVSYSLYGVHIFDDLRVNVTGATDG